MEQLLEAIQRIEKIDWSAFRIKGTSEQAIECFESFKQNIKDTKERLGIMYDPENDNHRRFSIYFSSLAEIIHPEMEVPREVDGLLEQLESRINLREKAYAMMGCRSFLLWCHMVEKYGTPLSILENPYELMVRFFELGGMYETEHNMHLGYF